MQIPIFSLNKVQIKNKTQNILKINNFEIHRGAAYFIQGNMAVGKTALLNLITKNTIPSSGSILYENEDFLAMSKNKFVKDLAYVEQSFSIPWGTVGKFIYKTLKRYPDLIDIDKKIVNISRQMEIKDLLDIKMSKLSPGQLRWVVLAANIAADSKVLVIDEIEQHLGAYHIKQLNKILYRKCNYDGVTLIASTQNKSFFQSHLASVIITLEKGKIYSVRSSSGKKKYQDRK